MPSIIPSYVYTLFACLVVGSLLVVTFSLSTVKIKNEADKQQLNSLAQYVATKSCELISSIKTNKLAGDLTLNLPSLIGNQRYWVQLQNDTNSAWIETGYGTTPQQTGNPVFIPFEVNATGAFVSGSGSATLECHSDDASTYLTLTGGM
jgi:hypothetical protein